MPTGALRHWRWTFAVLALSLLATAALHQTRGWIWLGVPPIGAERPPFSDAAAHLTAADACAAGVGQWVAHVCFLPSIEAVTHSQTYEPWLSFQRWGLTGDLYEPVGVVLIALFYLAIGLVFRPASLGEALLLLGFLFSAAVQLAVERANFDLLTSALLCLAAFGLSDRRAAFVALGCGALGAGTALKIYMGLASLCAGLLGRGARFVAIACAALATGTAIAILGIDNIRALGRGAPEGATRFSTGAHWLLLHYGPAWVAAAALCALLAAATAWYALRSSATAASLDQMHPRRTTLLQVAFLTAVPLFLLKDSYDYRFVLWLPCLALPIALLRRSDLESAWRRTCVAMLVCGAIAFGAELPCRLLDDVQARSGATWLARIVEALVIAKQFSAWLLAGLLGAVFALSLRQRWISALRSETMAAPRTAEPIAASA
jgi:hypothetical protein